MYALALILLNILSSAAYIERFYSLSGNICKTKSGNMGKNLIITRSLLKANIGILNDLSKILKNKFDQLNQNLFYFLIFFNLKISSFEFEFQF
jgi:hypothetical protein